MTKISIMGASGRMGRLLVRAVLERAEACSLSAACSRSEDVIDGIKTTTDRSAAFRASDVVIDFTTPEATVEHTQLAIQYKKPMVIGTTGLTQTQEDAIAKASHHVPVLYAANMSLGVNLLSALIEKAATQLNDDFDIEIFEAHHRHKADAPSGTALMLGRSAAKGRGVNLSAKMAMDRNGIREKGAIGMSVFRGGDVIGDHTVTFAGPGERVELSHKATDRSVFAHGAVKAAQWVVNQPPGIYTMRHMLGL